MTHDDYRAPDDEAPAAEEGRSCVYFIQAGEAGPIKIGTTTANPLTRLALFQTGNPETLQLLGHIEGKTETEVWALFESARKRGEWFHPTPELAAYIEAHAVKYEPPAVPASPPAPKPPTPPPAAPPPPPAGLLKEYHKEFAGATYLVRRWRDVHGEEWVQATLAGPEPEYGPPQGPKGMRVKVTLCDEPERVADVERREAELGRIYLDWAERIMRERGEID